MYICRSRAVFHNPLCELLDPEEVDADSRVLDSVYVGHEEEPLHGFQEVIESLFGRAAESIRVNSPIRANDMCPGSDQYRQSTRLPQMTRHTHTANGRMPYVSLLAALLAALRPTLPALYPELLCPKPCDAVAAVRA